MIVTPVKSGIPAKKTLSPLVTVQAEASVTVPDLGLPVAEKDIPVTLRILDAAAVALAPMPMYG